MTDFTTYQSPFSWRYGSPAMRHLWSEHHKRLLWRKIWVALAEVQSGYGLVRPEQAADLLAHVTEIDIPRALKIEAEIQHDLMAEVRVFAEQATVGGGIIHFGATSMDVEDNADALRLREGLDLTLESLRGLLRTLSQHLDQYAETPLIAFTHLQPAEPSTLGYRLAQYAQDLLEDYQTLQSARKNIRGKGFKGAVGTSASYAELLGAENVAGFEQKLSDKLALPFYPVATQTYPRKQDYTVLSALAALAQSLYKLAFDLRLLQSDSANRRTILPEAFLAADEMLNTMHGILKGLRVNDAAIRRNLDIYGPFAATERVLMAAVQAGASRQEMHETIRAQSMQAWETLRNGEPNPLVENLSKDPEILNFLSREQIIELMDYTHHVGNAPQKAREMAHSLAAVLDN